MFNADIAIEGLLNMPWPLTVNKADSATIEIRRNYSDEVKVWEELWDQSVQGDPVCDVVLKLDDASEIQAHWCILLLCPYFKALRHSGLYEKNSGKLDMAVSPATIVRMAIEFLYRGKVTIPKENLNDVIHCADYLQLDNLKFRCADYLRDHKLDVVNCVSMCTLASTYNLEALYDESNRILRRRFQEVISKDDILQLVTDSLKFLIGDQNLRYVGQLELFKLLVRWTDHSEDRKASFEELFELIDLHDLTSTDIETAVKTSSLVSENEKCRQRVDDHLDSLKEVANEELKDVLVFAGGQKWTGSKTEPSTVRSTACYGYVVQDDRWVRLSNVPRRMSGNLAVKNASELYILGKEENSVFTRLYKLPNKDVKEYWLLCSLEQPRTTTEEVYASVFCKDKLVSVRRENTRLFVCMHNPTEPTQTSVKNIMFLRTLKDVTTVRICCFKERYTFIMIATNRGGSSTNKTVILDTEKNLLDVLDNRGTCNGEIFYQDGDKIYLETPGKRFSTVFNFTTRRWTSLRRGLPALPDNVSMKHCECIKLRNDIYIFGSTGNDVKGKLPDLYRLQNKRQCWERLETPQADMPLLGASMVHFAIPRELLRCPFDCTHCSSKFVNSDYALDRYGYDDDEEDDESLYGPTYSDSDDDDDDDDDDDEMNFGYAPGFFFW